MAALTVGLPANSASCLLASKLLSSLSLNWGRMTRSICQIVKVFIVPQSSLNKIIPFFSFSCLLRWFLNEVQAALCLGHSWHPLSLVALVLSFPCVVGTLAIWCSRASRNIRKLTTHPCEVCKDCLLGLSDKGFLTVFKKIVCDGK